MNGAEFQAIRERCGLTQHWLADRHSVDTRTVRRWCSDTTRVPDPVALDLEELHAELLDLADEAAAVVTDGAELVAYRTDAELWAALPELEGYPVQYHRAMLVLVMDATGSSIRYAAP